MAHEFSEAELKINWADKHTENLQSCILEFLDSDFYAIEIRKTRLRSWAAAR
jgi:hypothetical protein